MASTGIQQTNLRVTKNSKPQTKNASLLVNIGQLLTLHLPGKPGPRRGADLQELGILHDAAVLCVAGKTISVGTMKEALRDSWLKDKVRKNRQEITEIDCAGKVVLPGFVDSHTHPAFTAPRLIDFERRIRGASYEEIAAAGGGIRSSVDGVRHATRTELASHVIHALQQMAAHGTTTVEAKSGYGLTLESEVKSLQAIRQAAAKWPGTVVPTLLGAHSVPKEFAGPSERYVEIVCDEMIPLVAKQKLAQFVDVFCDKVAFSPQETEQIFAAAEKNGLAVRAHVGQLSETALEPLLRFNPASFDHLDHVSDHDISLLMQHNTIATLVPGANYFLGAKEYPNARRLIDAGVPVALATDYNPGTSPTLSIPMALSLACTQMKMSPAQAITAATINGAWALRVAAQKGSIEPGKDADLAIFDVADYREIPYWYGANRCAMTIMNGAIVQRCHESCVVDC